MITEISWRGRRGLSGRQRSRGAEPSMTAFAAAQNEVAWCSWGRAQELACLAEHGFKSCLFPVAAG